MKHVYKKIKDVLIIFLLMPALSYAQSTITKTIGGVNPDYATFNDAITALPSFFTVLNQITFKVRDGIYNERIVIPDGILMLNNPNVIFQSESGNRDKVVLTDSVNTSSTDTNFVIKFDPAAQNITFKQMTIKARGNIYGRVIALGGQNNNINFIDNIIETKTTTSNSNTMAVVHASNLSSIKNLVFQNNLILNGSIGLNLEQFSIFHGTNFLIENNKLLNQYETGITITNTDTALIKNNVIFSSNTSTTSRSLYTDNCIIDIISNKLTNYNGTVGIDIRNLTGSISEKMLIANNMIYLGSSAGGLFTGGVFILNSRYLNIFNNSIHVSALDTTAAAINALLFAPGNINLINNILVNTGGGVAIQNFSGSGIFDTINYNDYYVTGNNLGKWNGALIPGLSIWRDSSTQDNASISKDPFFASNTSLYGCSATLDSAGLALSVVLDDVDGDIRNISFPDIGADEFNSGDILNAFILPDSILCQDHTLELNINYQGGKYLWSTGDTSHSITIDTAGIYTVEITNACSMSYFDTIKVSEVLFTVDIGNDTTHCGDYLLDAGYFPTFTYNWLPIGSNQTKLATFSSPYSLTITNKSCTITSNTANIIILSKPSINMGNDTDICVGMSILIDAQINPIDDILWSTGDTTQTINAIAGNTYSAVVTRTSGGCTSSDTITISSLSTSVNLGTDTSIGCSVTNILLDAGSPGNTYLWSTGDTTQTINVSLADTYSVALTDLNGCINKDTIIISLCTGVLELLKNDVLNIWPNPSNGEIAINIKTDKFKNAKILILNSVGKLVFSKPQNINFKKIFRLDLSALNSGIYFLSFISDEIKVCKKIVIE